ncbi:MAG: hypothetical protein WDW36_002743 [Sanguina aurantia]
MCRDIHMERGNNDDSDDSDADQAFPADYDPDLDDEEVLRLQAQEAEAQGGSGAAAESVEALGEAAEVADPMAEYPEPEQRSIPLDVLLAKANYIREAAAMHRDFPNTIVAGLQSDPAKVLPGDIYILHSFMHPESDLDCIMTAVAMGAVAVIGPYLVEEDVEELEHFPPDIPFLEVDDPAAMAQLLAVAFFGEAMRAPMVCISCTRVRSLPCALGGGVASSAACAEHQSSRWAGPRASSLLRALGQKEDAEPPAQAVRDDGGRAADSLQPGPSRTTGACAFACSAVVAFDATEPRRTCMTPVAADVGGSFPPPPPGLSWRDRLSEASRN